jgi:hypothetical protein
VEIMLDLSVSVGFTAEQRKVLQGYLVKDWKTMSAGDRDALLADVKTWLDAAAEGRGAKAVGALRPKLLAQLRTARDNQRSAWLLEIAKQERKKAEQLSQSQRNYYETARFILEHSSVGPFGHYTYRDGRRVWVPGR